MQEQKHPRPFHRVSQILGWVPSNWGDVEENRKRFRNRTVPFFLFCLALVRGLFYGSVVPPWGHYDEPSHFEYAWLIANRPGLPARGDLDQDMRREVTASMLEVGFFQGGSWRPNLLAQDAFAWTGVSQLGDPPLYYLLVALPLRFLRHADILLQLYAARLGSLLLYLASIGIAYGLMGELVSPGHPLRWGVAGLVALLPAYTDVMTAVNSDVGAVVVFSLFLWVGVRMIIRGISVLRLAGLVILAGCCVWTKNTSSVAVVLVPYIVVLAWFRRRWGLWVWLGLSSIGVLAVIAVFAWGNAAFWMSDSLQRASTSQELAQAPLGKRVLTLETAPGMPPQKVWQTLPQDDVEASRGMAVTVGAWIWASQPVRVQSPILSDGVQRAGWTLDVDRVPTFYAITTTVSADADYVEVVLPFPAQAQPSTLFVYYDGIVLCHGEWPQDAPPVFSDLQGHRGTWYGARFTNRIRNGSAEMTWPHPRLWVERPLRKYAHRSLARFLASMLDWERTSPVHELAMNRLFTSFWARFGWNEVGLSRAWYRALAVLTAWGILGALAAWARSWKSGRSLPWMRAVALLAVSGLLVWGNAFLRSHPVGHTPFIPVARYAYPVIIPSAMVLVGGWWTFTPRRHRRWFFLVVFSIIGLLDAASLYTLCSFVVER
jgi:hypothetical protein